jgi:hypothetical protein
VKLKYYIYIYIYIRGRKKKEEQEGRDSQLLSARMETIEIDMGPNKVTVVALGEYLKSGQPQKRAIRWLQRLL